MKKKAMMIVAMCIGVSAARGMEQTAPTAPNQKFIKAVVEKYLHERGDLCLGKFVWPIDVSEHDRQIGTSDALQMPVLEKLGLVVSSVTTGQHGADHHQGADVVKRYELTATGKKYYLLKEMTSTGPGGKTLVHQGDFCAAKLSLDKVIGWDSPKLVNGQQHTTVTYTYKIAAADWTRNAEIQQVFPRVDQVIRGAGTLQLNESFRLIDNVWVAVNAVD